MASIAQAIRMALHVGEQQLDVQDIFGQDVGAPLGGVFTCTQGLEKTWNAPLDERGIIGMATGLAMAGARPVAEIQFCDYIFNTIDLLKIAGNTCWCTAGQIEMPMVVMTPVGSGIHGSIYHSHSFESMATHMPGWKVVLPSNPLDVYGMLISAIKDPNPVMFLYPKALIRIQGEEKIPGEPKDPKELSKQIDAPVGDRSQWKPEWPALPDFEIPLGVAKTVTQGDQLTVISYGRTLPICKKVATALANQGYRIEVIDLRTLIPFDEETVYQSVQKTGRVLVVNEDTEVTNYGEHIIRKITEQCFYHLQASPKLLAGANTPGIGLAPTLEEAQVPQYAHIEKAMIDLITTIC
ncbi:MAG: alpha-ketoacid dehydrogenase subunit beta [Deltaproteobacteria bacterium]|nr:alpha-ketoacid dehydrogenase subunit beta [Deltaproteobacteria bacterium]